MTKSGKLYYQTCREQAGLTQEQAIVLLGIAETATLSRYENGHAPVNSDLAAAMVQVYRTPTLATWYLRYTNPRLVQYIPDISKPITDGDAMLQMELSSDDVAAVRAAFKMILRDGAVTEQEAEELNLGAVQLRGIANRILSAATYLEEREADGNG